ncbi:NADase-type glycan-binding domain-containing protein [Helicovermis profundi]|uniref:NAD glycohydrolase translocation F5/8 type C domain-containing protein n=1 Tax=Helicovermis profundi TaxID=3065157 RepID=A0AAU9ELH5_9FIRM|nr:hypothetical protein HLPR_12200 [Clostridia bacterium S502]
MKKYMFIILIVLGMFLLLACNNKVTIETHEDELVQVEVTATNFKIETILDQEESKIDVILKAKNDNSDIIWEKKWEGNQLTELPSNSDYVIFGDRIYIEVAANLYAMDINTGEEIFEPIIVGVIEIPILDKDGNIYCSGYYGPFLTKISLFGEIKWQVESIEEALWPGKPYIEGEYIYVPYQPINEGSFNVCQFELENGVEGNYYWIEENQLLWEKVEASSSLDKYNISNILDNNKNTAWVEGKDDSGIDEWIYFESPIEKTVSKMIISNGYHKSNELYINNNRVDLLEIETSDGSSIEIGIVDHMLPIEIEFEEPLKTNSIKLIIKSVFSGEKYDDTVISGIKFY